MTGERDEGIVRGLVSRAGELPMKIRRKFRKKPSRRPKKSLLERRRREKLQRGRLVALGVPAAEVAALNASAVREMLRLPAKITAA